MVGWRRGEALQRRHSRNGLSTCMAVKTASEAGAPVAGSLGPIQMRSTWMASGSGALPCAQGPLLWSPAGASWGCCAHLPDVKTKTTSSKR